MQKNDTMTLILSVFTFKDKELYYAYCPSLDIIDYGASLENAIENFKIELDCYLEYCIKKGTLKDDLLAHGWKLKEHNLHDSIKRS